jgi:hypothetical protein
MQVKDEEKGLIWANLDDHRVATFDHFLRSTPDILGNGAWDVFGKTARDSQEALNFAVSQLAYQEQKTYERPYAPMKFQQLVGAVIKYDAGEAAETVEYEVTDQVGQGRRASNIANDMPFADVASARYQMVVQPGWLGYFYTTQELRVAAYQKKPLPTRKQESAIKGFNRHMNKVALQGEPISNFTGLFNNASVTAANRPSGAVWDSASADTILADFRAGMTAVTLATKGLDEYLPKIVALPIASYQLLLQPRSTPSDTTILGLIKETYPGLQVYQVDELLTLGAGGTKRMVFFNPVDDNMVLHIPMPIRFLAPQWDITKITIPGEYRYGGLNVRFVPSMYYMDGI